MFKKTVKYVNFNGVEKEKDLYFNLTETEINKFEMSYPGGLYGILDTIIKEKDNVKIIEMFDIVVKKAYGVKSPDGERFEKGEEIYKAFEESAAYDEFFKWLVVDNNAAIFFNSMIPEKLAEEVKKQEQLKAETTELPSNT